MEAATTNTERIEAGGWTVTQALEGAVYRTTDPHWVIKRLDYRTSHEGGADSDAKEICEELESILLVFNNRHRIRSCPEFPRSLSDFCGVGRGYAWYAMRRYDGPLTLTPGPTGPVFWSCYWKRLAVQVLAFLEDYHTRCRRVHMDIKGPNILVDLERCQFVVTDFGLSTEPSRKVLAEYSADYLWYYLEFGAELYRPIASWRFDLTALGYLLARLCWNPENSDSFILMARNARKDGAGTLTPDALIAHRSQEMARGVTPLLYTYFDMLESLSWYDAEPPPRILYQSLASLFEA
jgi:serine/threonine protein kinase